MPIGNLVVGAYTVEPRGYGPAPGSNMGRTSYSPSNSGQCFRCNSINSVAIRTASAFESAFKIAQPPITSLVSVKGPSVTVILPLASRTRTPTARSPTDGPFTETKE